MDWKNGLLLVVVAFCGWKLYSRTGYSLWVSRPHAAQVIREPIDILSDPIQTTENLPEPFDVERDNHKYRLTPVANYSASGIVVSTQRYYLDLLAWFAPVDIGMIWGDVTKPEHLEFLSFDHGNRFLHWNYKPGLQLSQPYLISHAANNHIIAASDTVARAIETLKKGEKATLEGFLVNTEWQQEGKPYTWRTSTVRTDTSGGACEVIYLKRIRIGDEVFE